MKLKNRNKKKVATGVMDKLYSWAEKRKGERGEKEERKVLCGRAEKGWRKERRRLCLWAEKKGKEERKGKWEEGKMLCLRAAKGESPRCQVEARWMLTWFWLISHPSCFLWRQYPASQLAFLEQSQTTEKKTAFLWRTKHSWDREKIKTTVFHFWKKQND